MNGYKALGKARLRQKHYRLVPEDCLLEFESQLSFKINVSNLHGLAEKLEYMIQP